MLCCGKRRSCMKPEIKMETCQICFEDIVVDKMFSIESCLHRYCFSCMKQHVKPKLLGGLVVRCPKEGCESEVKLDGCVKFLESDLVVVIKERMKEATIPVTDKVYCPNLWCSALMSESDLKHKTVLIDNDWHTGARKCDKCCSVFCVDCKVLWHHNMTCSAYKSLNPYPDGEETVRSLAKSRCWRECVQCKHMIELAEGCYHIICRCGHQFCYTCGAEWRNKNATCSCPLWDEHYIIRA